MHPINIGSEIGPGSNLGVTYQMGTDSGLEHKYEDTDVTNGRTYYYAIGAVDHGYHESFYPTISSREGLVNSSPTECSAIIQTDLLGRAVKTDKNTVIVTPYEYPAGWVEPALDDNGFERVSGYGTGKIKVQIVSPREIRSNNTYSVRFNDDGVYEAFDSLLFTGNTNSAEIYNETTNSLVAFISNPDSNEKIEEFMGDGFRIILENDQVDIDTAMWTTGNSMIEVFSNTEIFSGVKIARDYEIRVFDPIDPITGVGADTAVYSPIVTDFQVWDVTNADSTFKVDFRFRDGFLNRDRKGSLSHGDKLQLVNKYNFVERSWFFEFIVPNRDSLEVEDIIYPVAGDVLKITTKKPFDRRDKFTFTLNGNFIDESKIKKELKDVYVVPDPYIAVSSLERKVINPSEGRGDRRVDFVNLPNECTVKIFTTSGRFVRELIHSSTASNARMPWDLRTRDGLEVAPGIYYFVVDAPGAGQSIGRFAIIK